MTYDDLELARQYAAMAEAPDAPPWCRLIRELLEEEPIRPPVCGLSVERDSRPKLFDGPANSGGMAGAPLPDYRSRLLTNADGDTAQISEPDDATVDATPPNVSSPIARIPAWVMFLVTSALLVVVTLVGGALIGGAVWLVRWIAR